MAINVKGRANLSTNPSFEYGTASIEVRRNLLINPGFRASTTGWTNNIPANAPAVVSSTDRDSGFVYRMTATGPYGPGVGTLIYQANVLPSLILYTASVWVKTSRAATMAIRSDNADRNPVSVPANTWTRLSATWTNATAGSALGVSISGTTMLTGDVVEVGDFLLETGGALLPFFDGSFNTWQSPDLTPSWVGAANTTASVLTGIRPTGAQAAYGNPVWLSTQSPRHGASFARTIVKTIGGIGAFIYATDTQGITAGETATYETNYRVSRTTTVATPSCTPPDTNGGQAWGLGNQVSTAGTWYTKRVTIAPNWNNSGHFINIASANVQYGDMIDIDDHFIVRGTYAGSYFDGNSSGGKWSGTQNNSVSYNDEVISPKSVTINARANYCSYPNFSFLTSGTIATGWAGYSNGGSGTRSFSGGQHTITMTGTSGGLGRYGISSTSANNRVTAFAGEYLFFACDIDTTAMDSATRAEMLAVVNFTDSTTVNWGVYQISGTKIERFYEVPAGKTVASVTMYCFIQDNTMPYAYSGTSTVRFSKVLITKRTIGETWTTYSYFDGNTSGAKWTGATNASASLIGDLRTAPIMVYNGTDWVSA